MRRNSMRRVAVFLLLLAFDVMSYAGAADPGGLTGQTAQGSDTAAQGNPGSPPPSGLASGGSPAALRITGLLLAPSGQAASDHIALNDKLAVVVDPAPRHPAEQYVLFLNDTEVKGLAAPDYMTLGNGQRALVFK